MEKALGLDIGLERQNNIISSSHEEMSLYRDISFSGHSQYCGLTSYEIWRIFWEKLRILFLDTRGYL